jgi:hypothetical protein
VFKALQIPRRFTIRSSRSSNAGDCPDFAQQTGTVGLSPSSSTYCCTIEVQFGFVRAESIFRSKIAIFGTRPRTERLKNKRRLRGGWSIILAFLDFPRDVNRPAVPKPSRAGRGRILEFPRPTIRSRAAALYFVAFGPRNVLRSRWQARGEPQLAPTVFPNCQTTSTDFGKDCRAEIVRACSLAKRRGQFSNDFWPGQFDRIEQERSLDEKGTRLTREMFLLLFPF